MDRARDTKREKHNNGERKAPGERRRRLPTFEDMAQYLKSDAGTEWRNTWNIKAAASATDLLQWWCEDNPETAGQCEAWIAENSQLLHGTQLRVEKNFRTGPAGGLYTMQPWDGVQDP